MIRTHLRLADETASGASGNATAQYKKNHGDQAKNGFYLSAKHLPASAPVTLAVDGVVVATYTTTAEGRLVISQGTVSPTAIRSGKVPPAAQPLPLDENFSLMKSLTLTDGQGTVLLSGNL